LNPRQNQAEQLVDSVDRERTDFIEKYFGVECLTAPCATP